MAPLKCCVITLSREEGDQEFGGFVLVFKPFVTETPSSMRCSGESPQPPSMFLLAVTADKENAFVVLNFYLAKVHHKLMQVRRC